MASEIECPAKSHCPTSGTVNRGGNLGSTGGIVRTPMNQKTPFSMFSSSGLVHSLRVVRDPIADFQNSRGVSRNEQITFVNLITSLCTQAYTAVITIFVMLWNLIPLAEGLLIFVRFILDKLIEICETSNPKDRALKAAIFVGELIIVLIVVFLIMGLIFVPVYVLTSKLLGKLLSMVW